MECCLELLDRGTLASLQDLGAAGLSSSSSEMASKGEVGLDIDVSKVPLREDDMEPFEIMISESQERMLCVVEPDKLAELQEVCDRWEVRSTAIGEVTDSRRLRVLHGDEVVGDMPVDALVDDCPLYDLEPAEPEGQIYPAPEGVAGLRGPCGGAARPAGLVQHQLAPAAVRAVRPVVQSRTVRRPEEADAAVLQLTHDGLESAIAVSIDGNGRRVACDPVQRHRRGGARVRRQPRLRGRRAARPHQLPELRQPREAPRGVAARALGGRDDRRAGGARRSGGGRQRLALQRVRGRPDLPDAGGGHGGLAARRREGGADRLPGRGRHDRLRGRVRAAPARQRAGQAARRGAAHRAAGARPRQGARRAGGGARRGPRGRPRFRARRRRGRLPRGRRRVLPGRRDRRRAHRMGGRGSASVPVRRVPGGRLRRLGRARGDRPARAAHAAYGVRHGGRGGPAQGARRSRSRSTTSAPRTARWPSPSPSRSSLRSSSSRTRARPR